MSYSKRNLVLKIGFFSLMMLLIGTFLATACDFNIEITDERRYLSEIGGTVRCSSKFRTAKGANGEIVLRLFLVDNKSEAIDLEGIDQEPYNFKAENIWIAKEQDADNPQYVKVEALSPTDGKPVPGVTAQVDIAKGAALNIYPNPRFIALKRVQEGKRVPKAMFVTLDMSKAEYNAEFQRTRVSALSIWVTSHFNSDATIGDLDLISVALIKNDTFKIDDIITFNWSNPDDAYFLGDSPSAFLYTTETVKSDLSEKINFFTAGLGKPPLYDSLLNGVKLLREVIKPTPEDDYSLYNPAVLAISLYGDTALLSSDKKTVATVPSTIKQLVQSYRGKGWNQEEGEEAADFVPLMAVVYPPPSPGEAAIYTEDKWNAHVDNLCKIASAAKPDGVGSSIYWGQLFIVYPYFNDMTDTLRNQLDMAYYAMTGYMELKFSYRLQGAKKGESYVISFRLGGKLLDTKIQIEEASPRIMFRVDVPK